MPDIRSMPLAELMPADYNPRTITDAAFKGLKASIERFGCVQFVVWNKRTGRVVGGHQRLRVLQEAGVEQTDVVVVDLPEAEEKALNLALNNPAIAGEFTASVQDLLDEIGAALPDICLDLRLDQIDYPNPNDVLAEYEGMPEFKNEDLSAYRQIIVSFRNDADAETFGKLMGQPVTTKTRSLWHPAEDKDLVADLRYMDDEA